MRIFEFYFNPKTQKDRYVKIFSFEPEKPKAGKQENLYIIGELTKALPANSSFLERLADVIRESYYKEKKSEQAEPQLSDDSRETSPQVFSPENRFKGALRRGNRFLAEEIQKGNVDWIGNLQFVVLLFTSIQGKSSFHFTKTGKARVWIARSGSVVDVGKEIADSSDSSKVFGNVVSGKILPEDKIIVLTSDLAELFVRQNLLQDLAFLRDEKQFQQLFKTKQHELSQVIGALFAVIIELPEKKKVKAPGKVPQMLSPLRLLRFPAAKTSWPLLKSARLKSLLPIRPLTKFSIPRVTIPNNLIPQFRKKNLISLFFLAVLLLAGFVLFQEGRSTVAQEAKTALEVAQSIHTRATDALQAKEEQEANLLLQEAWSIVEPYVEIDTPSQAELIHLEQEIEANLFPLNKIVEVENPEVFHEIREDEIRFSPKNLFLLENMLYIFNPFSAELYTLNISDGSKQSFSAPRNLKQGVSFANTPAFFAEPNAFLVFSQGVWQEFHLSPASPEFEFDRIGTFRNNLYVLDANTGDIVRYADPLSGVSQPALWLDETSEKKAVNAIAISIDGNIWIMAENGEIQRYFTGLYKESLDVVIFPKIDQASRFITDINLPYLYILDPSGQRVIILSKFGDVVRQYRSEAFDDLRDFALAPNGDVVYLLNGQKIYRIKDVPQL